MNKIPYEVLELKRIIEEDVPATPRLTINPLTYIIAMFFAKFDKEAYQSFGFKTITNAHQEIANILKVKPRTLENTRDNFDSQYNHPGGRKGHKDKKGSNTKKIGGITKKFYDCLNKDFWTLGEMKSLVQLILDNPNNGIDEYIEKFHSPAFRINDSNEINSIENTSMNESKTILEGKKYDIILSTHERKSEAREQCINYFREKIGNLYCIICKFDFEKTYGTIGKNYIHIHHINPLSSVDSEREVNPKKDLVPVCPNCHAMLHKKSPPFSVEDLKIIMKIAQKKR